MGLAVYMTRNLTQRAGPCDHSARKVGKRYESPDPATPTQQKRRDRALRLEQVPIDLEQACEVVHVVVEVGDLDHSV